MSDLKLEIDKTYKTRTGEILTILEFDGEMFKTMNPFRYYENGRIALSDETPVDLVEEYVQPMTTQQLIALDFVDPDLKEWAENTKASDDSETQRYWYSDDVPALDFNREMFAPGQHEKIPEGGVGIRTDDGFFPVALLPWRFKDLRLQKIICTLWPKIGANRKYTLGWDRGPAAEYTILSTCQQVVEKMQSLEREFDTFKQRFQHLRDLAEQAATPVELDRIRADIALTRSERHALAMERIQRSTKTGKDHVG